jgi:uncharacterized protein with PIN domain
MKKCDHCGKKLENPDDIVYHHPNENHLEIEIPLCPDCYKRLSEKQNESINRSLPHFGQNNFRYL